MNVSNVDDEYLTDEDIDELVRLVLRTRHQDELDENDAVSFTELNREVSRFLADVFYHETQDTDLALDLARVVRKLFLNKLSEAAAACTYPSDVKKMLWGKQSPKLCLLADAREAIRDPDRIRMQLDSNRLLSYLHWILRLVMGNSKLSLWGKHRGARRNASQPKTNCVLKKREQVRIDNRPGECVFRCDILFYVRRDLKPAEIAQQLGVPEITTTRYVLSCQRKRWKTKQDPAVEENCQTNTD